MRCDVIGPLAVVMVLLAHDAVAQESASTGAAVALFEDGVRLMDQGKYAEACPKLARSHQVSPNGGTLFALADCYAKNGQYASAWVAYKEAATRAQAAGKKDPERRALDAAQALSSKVTWVTLEVVEVDGLALVRDGQDVARAEWGLAVPLDPGAHRVEARARGYKPWTTEVRVTATAQRLQVSVPKLDPDVDPQGPARAAPVQEPSSSWSTQRTMGLAVAGVGVASLVVGGLFGLRASSKNDEAATHCKDDKFCDAEGLRLDDEGRSAATVSTVAVLVGGAALVGGAVLFLTAPSGDSRGSARRDLRLGAGATTAGGGAAAYLSGSF